MPNVPHGGLIAPSPIPSFFDPNIICRELTTEEIEELIHDFGFGAEIIANAGIDGIEIHAHQGYLLSEFLASRTNKRTDKYGGDLDGRLRIIINLWEAIKKVAGHDYPVTFRYGLTDHLEGQIPGARGVEEGLEIARKMEALGIDALHIDAGVYETNNWAIPTGTQTEGCLVYLAEMTKRVVNVPVITVGKLGNPALAERVLQEGKADFIALGRPLLADPEWVNKLKDGRIDDIRPCIGDEQGCLGRVGKRKYISCTVNPQAGNERNFALIAAGNKKKVIVIGGGPGGMEAARVSALRGHEVILIEKGYELGGMLIPASKPSFKYDYQRLINYFITQLKKLGVTIKSNTKATPELIIEMRPDIVFIATGANPIIPKIPGADKNIAMTAVDFLQNRPQIGRSVVVIGGNLVGVETAIDLAQQDKNVTIVEMLSSIMRDMEWTNALDIQRKFDGLEEDHLNVKVLTNTKAVEIVDNGVIVIDETGNKKTIQTDFVLFACGMKPCNDGLAESLEGKVPELYKIGDCVNPGKVIDAIWPAFRIARRI
jgi:2-enoate reductase